MSTPTQAQIFAESAVPKGGAYTSAAFPEIFRSLSERFSNSVLDLTCPSVETFTSYTEYFPKIVIEDLFGEIHRSEETNRSGDEYVQPITERLLPYKPGAHFDLIVCWDILNYLNPIDLKELVHHLSLYCHKQTYLVALISTFQSMPKIPNTFKLSNQDRVAFERNTENDRLSPRYSPNQLRKLIPEFEPEHVSLLRSGYYEILMVAKK